MFVISDGDLCSSLPVRQSITLSLTMNLERDGLTNTPKKSALSHAFSTGPFMPLLLE